jgi:hypothetical protein
MLHPYLAFADKKNYLRKNLLRKFFKMNRPLCALLPWQVGTETHSFLQGEGVGRGSQIWTCSLNAPEKTAFRILGRIAQPSWPARCACLLAMRHAGHSLSRSHTLSRSLTHTHSLSPPLSILNPFPPPTHLEESVLLSSQDRRHCGSKSSRTASNRRTAHRSASSASTTRLRFPRPRKTWKKAGERYTQGLFHVGFHLKQFEAEGRAQF